MSIIGAPFIGTEDYQNRVSLDGQVLFDYQDTPTATVDLGTFNVSQWQGVTVDLVHDPFGTPALRGYEFTWSAQQSGAQPLGYIDIEAYWYQTWFGVYLPNLGPWLNVTIGNVLAPYFFTEIRCAPTNRTRPSHASFDDAGNANVTQGNIAAGATETCSLRTTCVGSGIVSARCSETATLAFNVAGDAGYDQEQFLTLAANVDYMWPWIFPMSGWELALTNTSASNGTYNLSVMPRTVGMW